MKDINWVDNLDFGDSIINKDPYDGEHQLVFTQNKGNGYILFTMANNTKYPDINGTTETLHKSAIESSYELVGNRAPNYGI